MSLREEILVIRHHHEAWNGTGYPDKLEGKGIPYLARVFQILDIFEALSSKRPYKDAWPLERVIEVMREECGKGKNDPALMEVFLGMVHKGYGT